MSPCSERTPFSRCSALIILVTAATLILHWFLGTRVGLSIRATGDSPAMVRASSISPGFMIVLGLCISNAFTGLAGSLIGQYNKMSDINLGTGMVTIALASLIIGTTFSGHSIHMLWKIISVVIGSILYRFIISIALRLNVPTEAFKLVSAVIVAVAIMAPQIKSMVAVRSGRRAEIRQRQSNEEREQGKHPERREELMLNIVSISKVFNKGTVNEKKALSGLSLRLDDGDFATIVGSNGAGKSTLFNAIAGSFYVDSGYIELDGNDITYEKEHRRSRYIGRLFQDPLQGSAPHMTIEENLAIAYLRASRDKKPLSRITAAEREKFREQLSLLGMGLEDRMKNPVGLLSGGQRQALTLLMATMVTPRILLLDEHTAALDPATAAKVLDLTKAIVAERHITCLMVTHNMSQALEMGNRTLMMDGGRIVFDVKGEERSKMSVNDLLKKFEQNTGGALDNDRILLSTEEGV